MTDTKPISLGGRIFDVPALPLRLNMKAYPLCRKVTDGGLIARVSAAAGVLDCTEEEMTDLAEICLLGASAADPTMTRDVFESLPINPAELLDAFFVMRYQTGGWVPVAPQEGKDSVGEAEGVETPQTSTSEASSQN